MLAAKRTWGRADRWGRGEDRRGRQIPGTLPQRAFGRKSNTGSAPQGWGGGGSRKVLVEDAGDRGEDDAGHDRDQHGHQEGPARPGKDALSLLGQPIAHKVHAWGEA